MKRVMPVLFVGHGSPMNAIQTNDFTRSLRDAAAQIPKPSAIVVISAHWLTKGTFVTGANAPEQLYDFYGFPEELYRIRYTPAGAPELAASIVQIGHHLPVRNDVARGIDHGAWAILKHLYPQPVIPVIQFSLDYTKREREHYEIGKCLAELRTQGVLIVGSGNIAHNLRLMSPDQDDMTPHPWAIAFDARIKEHLDDCTPDCLLTYRERYPESAPLAVPTNEHYLPLLYVEAVRQKNDTLRYIYEGFQHQSLSMRSYLLDSPE